MVIISLYLKSSHYILLIRAVLQINNAGTKTENKKDSKQNTKNGTEKSGKDR